MDIASSGIARNQISGIGSPVEMTDCTLVGHMGYRNLHITFVYDDQY